MLARRLLLASVALPPQSVVGSFYTTGWGTLWRAAVDDVDDLRFEQLHEVSPTSPDNDVDGTYVGAAEAAFSRRTPHKFSKYAVPLVDASATVATVVIPKPISTNGYRVVPMRERIIAAIQTDEDTVPNDPIGTVRQWDWSGVELSSIDVSSYGFSAGYRNRRGVVDRVLTNDGSHVAFLRDGYRRAGKSITASGAFENYFYVGTGIIDGEAEPFGVVRSDNGSFQIEGGLLDHPDIVPPEIEGAPLYHRSREIDVLTDFEKRSMVKGRSLFLARYRSQIVLWDGTKTPRSLPGYFDAQMAVSGVYGLAVIEFGADGVPMIRRLLSRVRFRHPLATLMMRSNDQVYTNAPVFLPGNFDHLSDNGFVPENVIKFRAYGARAYLVMSNSLNTSNPGKVYRMSLSDDGPLEFVLSGNDVVDARREGYIVVRIDGGTTGNTAHTVAQSKDDGATWKNVTVDSSPQQLWPDTWRTLIEL